MRDALDDRAMAQLIAGRWRVAGTNLPLWTSGRRARPWIEYEPVVDRPLRMTDTVHYVDAQGRDRAIVGSDSYDDGVFTWRGRGLLRFARSRWWMTNADATGAVIVIRYGRTLVTPAGIDVLERADAAVDPRAVIAAHAGAFDIEPEEFATLRWLKR